MRVIEMGNRPSRLSTLIKPQRGIHLTGYLIEMLAGVRIGLHLGGYEADFVDVEVSRTVRVSVHARSCCSCHLMRKLKRTTALPTT